MVLMFHHLQGYVNVVLLFATDGVAADLAVLKTHQLMTAKVASLIIMIISLITMIIDSNNICTWTELRPII